ncbi:low-density lipoprotein receptor class A domain-containing protein 3-like [Rana temporaria]|uniref:low-density lipoprotein receptor class A domain-containing protein 3-like n=1 Tax=Rana temporaria TaxID=8407 RepID=UPI001AAC9CBA|nr:low-density lipoprotein receptor class A domain-containing protein 3-like [Rana temporaria]
MAGWEQRHQQQMEAIVTQLQRQQTEAGSQASNIPTFRDRELGYQQSPAENFLLLEDCTIYCTNEDFFQCKSSTKCFEKKYRCDGVPQCPDGSDEKNCTVTKHVRCQSGEFKCPSGECLLMEWKCDGAKDCKDGSDKKDCKLEKITCENEQWACASEDQCIPTM